jgi:CRISPR-associated endonuclease/helicase Cas3
MLLLTRSREGGYTREDGWSPESKQPVPPAQAADAEADKDSSDPLTFAKYRQTLFSHTFYVGSELEKLIEELAAKVGLDSHSIAALREAALKHDWGKAHEVFQETMHRNDPSGDILAKQIGRNKHSRKHFRHELASALAMLATGSTDLAAYLAAAHHGKVRLGIRSMPGERQIDGLHIARGIQERDTLEAFELAPGVRVEGVTLSLDLMELGSEAGSWTDRMLAVRDRLGPFRLAYLETLLRAADWAASEQDRTEVSR